MIPGVIAAGIASGAEVPYTASAVHFDGTVYLSNAGLVVTETQAFSKSIWLKTPTYSDLALQHTIFAVDPGNRYTPYSYVYQSAADPPGAFSMAYSDPGPPFFNVYTEDSVADSVWHNVLLSINTSNGNTQIYLDDVDATDVASFGGTPFAMALNGLAFIFGGDGLSSANNYVGDMADPWISTEFIDFSIEANRRKFIDASGKPVYLGANGELPTGTAPAIFFSGNAAAFGTNLGTGGAFTLTGSLTNASTSPSD